MYQGSPPANAVGAILFTSAREGWAFGPALWQTRDGGATWRKTSLPGGPVQDVGMAGDRVLAVTGRCGDGGWSCSFRGLLEGGPFGRLAGGPGCGRFAFQAGVDQQQVWLTSDGGRHWTPVTVR
jgi:photosystem II stability/assembly factor-like uncharacterized protein